MTSRRLLQVVSRQFTTTARRADEIAPGYDKLKAKQKLFQEDNGVPVHIKGGNKDIILYRLTLFMSIGGCVAAAKLFYDLTYPSAS